MNYQNIYNNLCNRSINRDILSGIYEKHHIIPRCMNGTDDITNIVLLTPREHFIAHKLLCNIYCDNIKLKYALWAMMNLNNKYQSRNYKISSREYDVLRKEFVNLQKNPKTEEHKKKISNSWNIERRNKASNKFKEMNRDRTGDKHPLYKKKRPEFSKFMKEYYKNNKRILSEETKQKISNSTKGRIVTNETKNKMIETAKNRPMVTCPHCNLTKKYSPNMSRYHMNNCKFKMETLNG